MPIGNIIGNTIGNIITPHLEARFNASLVYAKGAFLFYVILSTSTAFYSATR